MTEQDERNKQVVQDVFDLIYGQQADLGRIDTLIAENYRQHNPLVPQGRAGFREFFENAIPLPDNDPERSARVNVIASDNFVVRQEIRDSGMLVDIFELENGLLKEHWDSFRFNPERWPFF
ncbi:hypothetical protein H351_30785 (plasmid) [Rhodococcus erythropolis R138]|uniref:nuclear transport factor 2 family protein n=1 Tax=Rhodococcus erythropolis TaxID=1833 RepID=UPI0004923953|nr:nuclear transport factor 2 family protein [Rhodococcus erythropolis]ALU73701.1 hypothetical protein H351_30785 [Rhodococcus erythropolis R138]